MAYPIDVLLCPWAWGSDRSGDYEGGFEWPNMEPFMDGGEGSRDFFLFLRNWGWLGGREEGGGRGWVVARIET